MKHRAAPVVTPGRAAASAHRPLSRLLALALVLLAAVWLYVPALHTEFFADDYLFLDQVRDRSLSQAIVSARPAQQLLPAVEPPAVFLGRRATYATSLRSPSGSAT